MWSREDSLDETVRSKNHNTEIQRAIHDWIVRTKQDVAIRWVQHSGLRGLWENESRLKTGL